MPELPVVVTFSPALDVARLNVMIMALKRALGPLGQEIKPIDGDALAAELRQVQKAAKDAGEEIDRTDEKLNTPAAAGSGVPGGRAFQFNQLYQSVTAVSSAVQDLSAPFTALDTQVKNIGTLGVENFEAYADLAIDLSTRVPDSAAAIAAGVYDAIGAGVTGTQEEIISFVETASKMAVAGMSDTQSAVNGLTSVMNAYKLPATDAARVSDIFFGAINVGKTTLPEMNASLANVIPAASAAGVVFEEVAAMIAQMTSLGVPTSQATTQIRSAIVELQKPAGPLASVMNSVGLNAANIGEEIRRKGLIPTLQKVEKAAASMGLSMTQVFSSSEAASAALLVTGENASRANSTFDAVQLQVKAKASQQAFAVASEGIEVQAKITLNKIQSYFMGAFDVIGGGAISAANTVASLAPTLTAITSLKSIVPDSAITSLKVALDTKALPAIQKIAPALFTASAGGKLAFAGLSKAAVAFATNPVFLTIAGIAAVVTATKLLTDALNETAAERAAETNEQLKFTQQQKAETESRMAQVESTEALAWEYVHLAKQVEASGLSAEEAASKKERLSQITEQLNGQYPGVIKRTGDLADNLDAVKKLAADSASKIDDLQGSLDRLSQAEQDLLKLQLQDQVDVAAEDIENMMTEIINDSQGFMENKAADIGEWLGLGSAGRVSAQQFVKSFTLEMQDAKNGAELADAYDAVRKRIADSGAEPEQVRQLTALAAKYHQARLQQLSSEKQKEEETGAAAVQKKQEVLTVGGRIAEIEAQIKSIEEQRAKIPFLSVDRIKQLASLDSQRAALQKELEQLQGKNTKSGESAYDLAKKKLDTELRTLTNEEKRAQVVRESRRLDEGRKRTAEDELADATAHRGVLAQQLELENRRLATARKYKDGAKDVEGIQARIQEINVDIAAQENTIKEAQAGVLEDARDLAQKIRDERLAVIEFEVGLGLANNTAIVAEIGRQLAEINQEVLQAQTAGNSDLVDELQAKMRDLYQRQYDLAREAADRERDLLNDKMEREAAAMQARLDRERAFFDRLVELQERLGTKSLDLQSDDRLAALDAQKKRELDAVGDSAEAKEQLERVFAARREAVEEEIARKRQVLQARIAGQQAEADRVQAVRKLEADRARKAAELATLAPGSPEAEKARRDLAEIEGALSEKADSLNGIMETMSAGFSDAMAGLFSGDPEAMRESVRGTMSMIAGILENLAAAAIEKMVLDWLLIDPASAALPFWVKLGVIPMIKVAARGLVGGLLGPVLAQLASFASGGRVDEPTVAVVGDAARAGMSRNTEWIFRDQDIEALQAAQAATMYSLLRSEFAMLRSAIDQINGRFVLTGEQIRVASDRNRARQRQRYR
ncbi:MAG: phage tail tape measure protein [Ignavibacteriae bacterium]|nr:phage tail tape measure protein [Ignavibacteriota bacterium]